MAVPASSQHYHVRQYTVEDGLPSAHVRDVTQDSEGRLWFATRSGITVYDGLEWATYNVADGLTWADQFALRWDGEGMLWSVGAIPPFKIFYLDQDRWHELPGPDSVAADLEITSFAVLGPGHSGTVAIGTDRAGILLCEAGSWRAITVEQGLPSNVIRDLVIQDDRLIVATPRGLATIAQGEVTVESGVLPPGRQDLRSLTLEALGEGDPGRLWILGEDWIGRLTAGRFELLDEAQVFLGRSDQRWVTAADHRGGLFLGTSSSFFSYHPQDGVQPISRDNGILADGVTALYLDRESNLWIGSERGASKLVSRQFARYDRSHGIYDDEVTAVLERRDGDIVLGHRGGVSILTGSGIEIVPLVAPDQAVNTAFVSGGTGVDRISGLAEDREGNLWLAAGKSGLVRIDSRGQQRWFRGGERLTGTVTSVLFDSAERLWAATEMGLYRFHRDGFVEASRDMPTLRIRRIFESRGGDLLVAAASGLYRFSEDGWQNWSCSEDKSCNSVFAVLEDDGGGYLVGTSAGLHRTAASTTVRETRPGLKIDRPIYFMVRDDTERIWFGTDDGVLRWDGLRLEHFTVEDGLAGRETHRAAGMVDSRGKVWIGTERGATVYSEPRPGPPRGPPIVSLTGLDVSGRLLPLTVPHRLGHGDNDLIFQFRAVSMLDEDRILISSRLEGFESTWRAPYRSPDREQRYINLPPGRYQFHLKAANADGTWSETVSSAELFIALPFWQRTWFFLLIAVAMAAALYAASSHQSQRKYSRRLEVEVAERVAQLMTEKERLALTLRNIGDGVITTDARGEVVLLNRMAEEITGWSSADAVGNRLERVLRLHEPAPAGDLGPRLELPGPHAPGIFEEVCFADLVARRGDRRLVELSGSPILQANESYTGQVLAFRDVTEKRKIESELAKGQKLEALGLLAGGIAHDFNNLLTVLLGNLSLLSNSRLPEERKVRHLADAENAVLRARDLTQQLLTFSRGGAPVRKAGSISEVIRDSASFVMSGSKVRCEIELPSDLWVVDIDAGQISQVVNNLLINAIQAMPEGGTVRIVGRKTTTPSPSLPAGKYIAIDVIDHGVGIPQQHQNRVFDPYFSTKQEGRGLGLASAYSIAKQHEGLLTVESQHGEGTVFSLYLPASKDQVVAPAKDHSAALGGGGRILIMDDEDAVRHVTGSIIEQLGFQATYAIDGREAIDHYRYALERQEPYDVVIMDLTIPGGMGGQEAISHLRALDPEVRAVVMSGYSNDPVLANYREYGFLGRIGKPFAADDLAKVLSEVI